ncbi:hypothetical protein CHELA20_40311 [Hyphomicrobiales bacterium]|nr:hypothetical protein CHELA20_40311 [Hyphomicrobiales bacterium]CAH1688139.1 hypothetical protein CHELA41_40168 [Hyphomicrobiales bacterium]
MTGFPCRGLLRELRRHDGHQGQLPCDAEHRGHSIMPSLVHMLDIPRTGEVAGRSPCPCVPQVDAAAMVWLCSPHGSLQATYMYAHIRMPPTYVSGDLIGISPVKPCRRRRHFNPRMRINRFVFLNLPVLQPREPSRRNGFTSIPFTCGLRHPAS